MQPYDGFVYYLGAHGTDGHHTKTDRSVNNFQLGGGYFLRQYDS